jgi:hypothetical protein
VGFGKGNQSSSELRAAISASNAGRCLLPGPAIIRAVARAGSLEHFRFTYRHCNIVQCGFFFVKNPLGIQASRKSRIEIAMPDAITAYAGLLSGMSERTGEVCDEGLSKRI